MFNRIIYFSIHHKLVIAIFLFAIVGWGIYNLSHLPLDAVPDITDNQVQVITSTPDLSAQEVERLITYPLEMEMGNIPRVTQIRSISRFGLSVITIVFEESVNIYWAREQISQKLQKARGQIPNSLGNPEMGPISTGLGEIYQYVIYPEDGFEDKYSATELRSIQDWIIKRQLIGISGVVEVNSSGGYLKQYEIALDQNRMRAFNVTLDEIYAAVNQSNANAGGSYIEKEDQTFFIRGEGMARSMVDLEHVVIRAGKVAPILIKNVAEVKIGHAPRFGAVTLNGKGEVVAGQVMMLKGANSMEVTRRVKERIEEIKKSLPEGIVLEPYLDRSKLVNQTTYTVSKNLIEGALIVIFILVLLLGNLRAGLIVASVIPISMLFAVSFMRTFGVSANLMSLGALDFGLIVDGAVIIVESILHHLGLRNRQDKLTPEQKTQEVFNAASRIRKSAAFGEIIILMVYLPIFFLQGVEGKMFIPMAQTVSFAILGALILSLTYVPMMSDLFLKNTKASENGISDRIIHVLYRIYAPIRELALNVKYLLLAFVTVLFFFSLFLLSRMGSEFIPTLEEGDFALHQILPPGSSIKKGVDVSAHLQDILTSKFPEVEKIVTKIGTAEIPTDIMPLEAGDIFVIMKPKDQWVSASGREEMFDKMEKELNKFPGVIYEFTQPIQMRFNELMTGIRQDIAIKIYGEDLGVLIDRARKAESILRDLDGVGDIKVEATAGLQQMVVDYDILKMAKYGVSTAKLNDILKSSFAGKKAGNFYEGERQFDVVIRLRGEERQNLESLQELLVDLPNGNFVPMSELANISFEEGPTQISRDDTRRRITIGVNARRTDIATLVSSIEEALQAELELPPGYFIRYGGQFENLQRAQKRLGIVVPIALLLIFLLLYFTFNSVKYALLIYVAIPLSAIGGIWALYLRGMPFSISAGVGFIALFGVAVLNGIVLVSYFNHLKKEGMTDILEIIRKGTRVRLRPVVMTAAVASLGFLPMALSHSAGAEVQQPLATVVIGGLITATFLTMVVIPILYYLLEKHTVKLHSKLLLLPLMILLLIPSLYSQEELPYNEAVAILGANDNGLKRSAQLQREVLRAKSLRPIAPNQTVMSLSSEEFNFDDASGIQSLNFRQNFRLRNPRQSYDMFYQSQEAQLDQTLAEQSASIAKDVMEIYIEASHLTSLIEVESAMQQHYSKYLELTKRRADLGEASRIEERQMNQSLSLSLTESNRLIEQKRILMEMLYKWLQRDNWEVPTLNDLSISSPLPNADDHPSLLKLRVNKQILEQKKNVSLVNSLPQLFSGLQFQRVNGSTLFFGFELGISITLDKSFKTQQNTAYQLAAKAIDEQIDWQRELLLMRINQLQSQSESQQIAATQISDQISSQSTLLEDLVRAFQMGEVEYTEIILGFQNYYNTLKTYLEKLKNHYLNQNELRHYVNQKI